MGLSKKDLRTRARKDAEKNGTAVEIVNGKPAKAPQETAKCTKCFLTLTLSKKNQQLKDHVSAKHSAFSFSDCFPEVPVPV